MKPAFRFTAVLAAATLASLTACGGGSSTPPTSGGNGGNGRGIPTLNCTKAASVASNPSAQSLLRIAPRAPQPVSRRLMTTVSRGGYVPGVVEVAYDRAEFNARRDEIRSAIARIHANVHAQLDLDGVNRVVQILHVAAGQEETAMAQLRANPMVKSISRGAVRHLLSTAPYFPKDPYYGGFPPANVAPYYEQGSSIAADNIPGQWDMHAIGTANAWGYSQSAGNTSGELCAGALGGNVPIAIIDTGADVSHPELSGKISYAEEDLNGVTTVDTGNQMQDLDGHGTDVAGIAAAAGNNNLGFAGVAFASPLLIFKVFPNPPSGGCAPGSTSNQCTAQGSDIAQAVSDAVTHGAKIINLSLGDTSVDTAEQNAVENAISKGVVVVAASGNGDTSNIGQPSLDFPAGYQGVIAVGASALDDSNPSKITEKVASYSNYGTTAQWGLVAPGGDPTSGSDVDDFHWIENIYSSEVPPPPAGTPGSCVPDFGSSSSVNDCRILIAGTSQATPHVAGAAALLVSLGTPPSQVQSVLCSTADSIPSTGMQAGCGRLNVYRALAQIIGDPNL